MRRMRACWPGSATGMLAVASLVGCGGGVLSPDLVLVNGGEPPYPLIPTSTNDSHGGRIIDRLFAGLVSYDAAGRPAHEVAQSIETTDNVNYRIILKPGWKFTDGSPVTAHSFVDAWNYGALSTNAQLQQSFFSPIDGFDEVAGATGDGKPAERDRPPCPGCRWSTTPSSPCGSRRRPSTSCCGWAIAPSIRCRTAHFATWRRSAATRSATARTSSPTARTGRPGSTTSRSTCGPTPATTATAGPTTKG